ncbi:MAG: LysM peptidoglycan-binding domain-containing M23 family metallopeptidase, partial [Cyanobacteria bacterium J06648_11]
MQLFDVEELGVGKQSYSGDDLNAFERTSGMTSECESTVNAGTSSPVASHPRSGFARLRYTHRKLAGRVVLGSFFLGCLGISPSLSTAAPDTTLQFSQQPIPIATVPLGAPFERSESIQEVVSHRVRSGETLWKLSRQYGVDVDAIASANNLNRGTKLETGQVLYILRTQAKLHAVARGETLNSIARRYGVSVSALMQASPGLRPNDLKVGQRLSIPAGKSLSFPTAPQIAARPPAGLSAPPPLATVRRSAPAQAAPAPIQNSIIKAPSVSPELASKTLPYQAKSGDSLDALARRYGISKQSIQLANPGLSLKALQSGQKIRLPRMPGVLMHKDYAPGAENGQLALLTPPASQSLPRYSSGFIRPVTGPVTSGYGWRWGRMHHGVDFGGPVGSPISAAMGGEVIFAGWDSGGYGNRVDIRHPNGMVTRYA